MKIAREMASSIASIYNIRIESSDSSYPSSGFIQQPFVIAVIVFLASLALYVVTLAPGLLWGGGDFATFQTWAFLGTVETTVGVYGHALWVYVAHPFTFLPINDAAWRANFAAAVFAAVALSFVYLSAWHLTRSRMASQLATGALAVSHTFWTYAVMPKVYSLNALFLAVCCYLLIRWRERENPLYLFLFAFLYGLSFLNHLVMITAAAGFAAFIGIHLWPRRQSPRVRLSLLVVGLFFVLGLAPYIYLMFQGGGASSTGGTILSFLSGFLYALTQPRGLLNAVAWGVALGIYQFPITILVGLLGLYLAWRYDRGAAALVIFSVLGTFAFLLAALDPTAGNVYVWNLHYYLQAYLVLAFALAIGLKVLLAQSYFQKVSGRAAILGLTLLFPILLYTAAPSIARNFWRDVPDFRPLAGRDNLTYVLTPWKQQENGARPFGEDILKALPPNSILFSDYSIWAIIHYLQVVEGARPDVQSVMLEGADAQVPVITRYRNSSNLYLADIYRYYDLQGIQEKFEVVPEGPIYRLVPK